MAESWSWGNVTEGLQGGVKEFIRLCNVRFKRLEGLLRQLLGRPRYYYPEDFGLSAVNVTAAVQAAANAAGADGGGVVALRGTSYTFGSAVALTSAHDGVVFEGSGRESTTLLKGFSGDLFTLTAAPNVQFRGFTADGQHGTYTGRGFVLTGASDRPAWRDILCKGFTSEAIRFEADAGRRAWVEADFTPGTGQTDAKYVWIVGTDTVPCYRRFVDCIGESGYFDVDGASDTVFDNVQVRRIEIDDASSITSVLGGLWGNSGSAMTISGTVTRVLGVRFSGDVTLDSDMTGCFIGNVQTSGTFTDNTAINACLVRHHPLNENYHLIDKHKIYSGSTTGGVVRTGRTVAPGDAAYTWNPYEGVSDILYNTTLTTSRAVTLSTTSAFGGAAVLVRRTAGGAYLLDVGGLVNLAPMEWCWVVYTGSSYVVVAAGKVQQVGTLSAGLRVAEDDMSGTTQYGLQVDSVTQSDAATNGIGVYARTQTAAASFTQGTATSLYAANPSAGAGSTITTAIGIHVENITAGGTNNYALRLGTGNVGFHGVTPAAQPAALTQTYSTADRTLSAYTADNESGAYTGIDNLQAGTVYATVADLNALRVAYENLRAFTEDLAQHHNAVVDDLQAYGLEQ